MQSQLIFLYVLFGSYEVSGLNLTVKTNFFEIGGSGATLECNLDGAAWDINTSPRVWKAPPNVQTVITDGSANTGYTEDLSDVATAGIFRMTTPPLDWSIENQFFQCGYLFSTASLNATRSTLARNSGGSASYDESTKKCVFTISEILPSPTKVVTHVPSGSGETDISQDSRVEETLSDNNDQGQTFSYRIEVDGSNMKDGDQVKFQVTAGPFTENGSCDIKKSGLSGGAIAGIVIAVVVVIAAVVIPLILWKKKLLCFKGNKLGDLVWAKLERYPWWPGLVCNHPTELTHQKSQKNPQIHVQFFDDPPSRAWIKAKNVKEFKGSDHADFKKGGLFFSLSEDIQKGAKEADEALKLTKERRLKLLVALQPYDDKNMEFHGYKLGDLVWAKLEGYPWWPSLICNRPTELTHQNSRENPQIHVQFFDDPQSRAWIKAKNVREFKGSDHADFKKGGLFFSLDEDVQKGAKEADDALKLTKKGRLELVADMEFDDGTEKTIKTTNAPTVDSGNVTYSEVATTDPKLDIENKKRHNELDPLTVLSDRQTEINKKKPMPDIGQKSE